MIQFFSKNFFSRIFPVRYFQKTRTQDATVNLVGLELNLNYTVPTVEVDTPVPVRLPSKFTGGSGGPKKGESSEVRLSSHQLLFYVGKLTVEAECIWETEEDIIELVNIIFQLMDYNFTNNYKDTEEEEMELIMSLISSDI